MHNTHQDILTDELRRFRFTLKRGGDVERHLVLKFGIPLATSDATLFLDTIRAESHWVWVSVTVSTNAVSSSLFAPWQPSLAVSPWRFLQFLHIAEGFLSESSAIPRSFTLSPEDAPSLRHVVVSIGNEDLKQCVLPWSQLSRVWLSAFPNNLSDYFEVLSQCSRAEKCVFELPTQVLRHGISPVENISPSPMHIHSLFIQFPSFDSSATVALDMISTPALKELSLSSTSISQASDIAAIQAAERLIRRSGCNITKLQLGVNHLGPQCPELLAPILDTVSGSLLSLTLVLYNTSPSYFTSPAPKLPRLEVLQLVTTERIMPAQRSEDVDHFVRWAQTWSQSIADVLSGDKLDRRKEGVRFTYVSVPASPMLGFYYSLHRNPDYCRNGRLEATHSAVQRLNEDGWHLDIIFVDP